MESSSQGEIRVLLYRELEGHIEIFLRKNLSSSGEYQDFRGLEKSSYPSVYFTAVGVLLTDFIGLISGGKGKELLIGIGGIYVIYFFHDHLQERIIILASFRKIPRISQSFLSFILGSAINNFSSTGTNFIKEKTKIKLSLFNFLSIISCNTALAFVSYRVQAFMKSVRVFPILLVGFLFGRRDSSILRYVCAVLITIGIFNLQVEQNTKESDKVTSYFGLALVLTSLLSDGMLANLQRKIKINNKIKHNHMNSIELMTATNKYCFLLCFLYSIFTHYFLYIYSFISKYPAITNDLITISLLGCIGQIFIFYVLRHFGPMILAIITTTRQFFTVIVSILYYNHNLSGFQWVCVLFVFFGMLAKYFDGIIRNKHEHKQESEDLNFYDNRPFSKLKYR